MSRDNRPQNNTKTKPKKRRRRRRHCRSAGPAAVRLPKPVAPPPVMKSRKRARVVTTRYHQLTKRLDEALLRRRQREQHDDADDDVDNDNNEKRKKKEEEEEEIKQIRQELDALGGIQEYQRASQLNTSLFSTSKWVLRTLAKRGWLQGIPVLGDDDDDDDAKKIESRHEDEEENDDSDNKGNRLVFVSAAEDEGARQQQQQQRQQQQQQRPCNCNTKKRKKKLLKRRNVRLLEIGAINTELLDAAARTVKVKVKRKKTKTKKQKKILEGEYDGSSDSSKQETGTIDETALLHGGRGGFNNDGGTATTQPMTQVIAEDNIGKNDCRSQTLQDFDDDDHDDDFGEEEEAVVVEEERHVHKLSVRAIDLHPTHVNIEETDFLRMPVVHPENPDGITKYDVIVCSMVLNCVPTPEKRGRMLLRLYDQLRPGGLCFLTVPKSCLTQSKYMTMKLFCELLSSDEESGGVGFVVEERRESPKVVFFVLSRPSSSLSLTSSSSSSSSSSSLIVEEKKTRKKPESKVTEGTVQKSVSSNSEWTKLAVINKGKKYRNTFAVVLNKEEV